MTIIYSHICAHIYASYYVYAGLKDSPGSKKSLCVKIPVEKELKSDGTEPSLTPHRHRHTSRISNLGGGGGGGHPHHKTANACSRGGGVGGGVGL